LRVQATRKLRGILRLGHFKPGMRLTEKAVADMLGISRTPAREALGALAERGVLDMQEQGGYVVPQLTHRDIDELYKVRALLEIPALQTTIQRADSALHEQLAQCLASLAAARDDYESTAFLEHVLAFRELLFSGCGNELLMSLIARLDNHTESLKAAALADANVRAEILNVYSAMAEAIRSGEIDRAASLLRTHHDDGRLDYHAQI
jgi:DNA-binding GntR family transcriptional regulator